MKDERLIKADKETHDFLNLSQFPNFHESGSIEGMRNLYYGKDAFLVHSGEYIYRVDEDTFQAVKDHDYIRQQPAWMNDINSKMVKDFIDRYKEHMGEMDAKKEHEFNVMSLAVKSDMLHKMNDRLTKSISDVRYSWDGIFSLKVDFRMDQKQDSISLNPVSLDKVTKTDPLELRNLLLQEIGKRRSQVIFKPLYEEMERMNEEHNRPVVSFIDDARIDNTVEKISAVLSKHYSLHEADWLCRIITDPKKNQQDILEAMKEIERAYEADEELVMDDNEDEDLTLTKADARTFYDLQNALEQKYPEGVTIGVESFKTDDIFSYIQFGQFRDSSLELAGLGEEVPATADTLQAEVRVPKDEICRLSASQEYYCNESYEDFINELDDSEAYDASTTELMHCHPDLKGAKLVMYDALLPKKLYVEGHPVDECVAWMLQSSLFNEQELSRVLHEPEYAAATMDEIRKAEVSEYDRNRIAKMNLPEGMDMMKNPERMYFFEKGVLGFAEVDRMRGVRYSGETMSREGQDFINDFVAKKNIEQRQHQTFFITPGVGSELKAYLDTIKNKLVKVDVQQDIYGRTMFTDGTKILSEGVMQHFQDITGRITEAVIVGIDKPMVRCKIDGEQQSGSLLNKAQRIMYASHMDNAESRKKFAESMAVAHFATALYDSPEQSRNKGMGR